MDKYKKLAANTIIFAIGSFGSKILSFLLINLYTTHMSPDDYGNADLIIKLGNFLIPIFSLSIADAILRYGIDKDYSNSQVFTTGITTILFGSTILALLSPIFNLIPFLDGNGFLLYIFIYASGFRAVCSQFVRGKGQVKLFAFDGIFATLTMFIFNLIFLVGLDMGMKGYVLSLILSDISSTIFLMFAANLPKYLNPRALNKDIAKTMIRYSLPLIPTALLWNITSLTDGLFVKYGVGDAANGVYTAAYKIPNLIAMVSTMFIQAWNMSAISEHKEKGIEHFYTKVFSSYQSMMYLAGGALLLIIKPLTNLLVGGEKFAGCYKFTPLLVLAVLMTCFSQFMSSVYSATQHTKNSFTTSLVGAVINIILSGLLVGKFGIQGVSFATFVSYFVCYVIRLIDTRRYIKYRVNFLKDLINLAILGGMSVSIMLEPKQNIIYLAIGAGLIFILNIGTLIKTAKQLLKKRK